MPRNLERDARELARRKQKVIEAAYPLFTERPIDSVSLREIAKASGMSEPTLYRHYPSKTELVVTVATWVWGRIVTTGQASLPVHTTAAQDFEFFLDSILELYRNRRDVLRFNQFFNVYVQSEHIAVESLGPYQSMIGTLREGFHYAYAKGEKDGTLRTEVPEEEMFSATLHLMLAVVTRYAVGLVYDAGIDPDRELLLQKSFLMREYTRMET